MKNGELKRQGDVALERMSSIPKGSKKMDDKPENFIIARGEHSNHSHIVCPTVEGTPVSFFKDSKGELYFTVDGDFTLEHLLETHYKQSKAKVWTEEHVPVAFPAGTYKYIQQTEFHPYEDAIRAARD